MSTNAAAGISSQTSNSRIGAVVSKKETCPFVLSACWQAEGKSGGGFPPDQSYVPDLSPGEGRRACGVSTLFRRGIRLLSVHWREASRNPFRFLVIVILNRNRLSGISSMRRRLRLRLRSSTRRARCAQPCLQDRGGLFSNEMLERYSLRGDDLDDIDITNMPFDYYAGAGRGKL